MTENIKVYYNSACPVCKMGIEGQQDKMQACAVEWNDVHADNQLTEEIHAQLEAVRERLHVVDERGDLRVGFDAFLTIWQHSPNERWKARLFGIPIIKQVGRFSYNVFAALLYRWNRAKKHW